MAATLNHSDYSFANKQQDNHLLAALSLQTPPHNHSLEKPPKPVNRRTGGHVDPLIIAAVTAAADPDITRNHYVHDYFPHALAYASCDDEVVRTPNPARLHMQSQQAPRRVRLAAQAAELLAKEEEALNSVVHQSIPAPIVPTFPPSPPASSLSVSPTLPSPLATLPESTKTTRRVSLSDPAVAKLIRHHPAPSTSSVPFPAAAEKPKLVLKCLVRTRVPTPHGHVFLHLYKNNLDDKEHLAFVADQAQMDAQPGEEAAEGLHFLRSQSLDSEWREGETEIERIVRGAYVGRLSAASSTPSVPGVEHLPHHHHHATPLSQIDDEATPPSSDPSSVDEPPLVRIHSECFTGETIGSQRCDCGEQLDEAFRLIRQEGRGIIVYLRQEGRGIGLMEKMRAYNLQDLGHDTVAANLLLGHGADLRTYDVAGAILRDFGVPEVRLLTNNPDKIEQIEKEGIAVVERVAMVPRSWTASARKDRKKAERKRKALDKAGAHLLALTPETVSDLDPHTGEDVPGRDGEADVSEDDEDEEEGPDSSDSDASHNLRRAGVGMIGASTTRSAELDKYLATKIKLMGHLLELPSTPPSTRAHTPRRRSSASLATKASLNSTISRGDHPLSNSMMSEGSSGCRVGCECLVESTVEDGEA